MASTVAKLEIYGRNSCKELQFAHECQAHSEDQICIVNGFTVGRIMDIMWIYTISIVYDSATDKIISYLR